VLTDTVVADTVVGAATRRLREGTKGTNVAGVVLLCASALVGIFFILVSVVFYLDNRGLAAHGVRTQGQVVYAHTDYMDEVVFTVDGTDYWVPGPEVGDRLPGEAVTVVYDPRDPSISNLEDDSWAWHLHWVFLGVGLFFLAIPAVPVVAGILSRSTVQPGLAAQPRPVTPLDEKVSGATLVEWAAWAASTTFSSTGLRLGYDKREVDAFRSAVRDTFLGGAIFWVSTPPVKSDDVHGKQFPTHRPGYHKKQVDAFLEAAGLRLAAMESTDRPAGPLVSDALLVAWAEWADSTTFSKRSWTSGYGCIEVDAFRKKIRDTFLGATRSPVKSDDVRGKQFSSTNDGPRYDKKQVDAFLDAAGIRLAAMESTDRPPRPLVSGAILAKWADSSRFSTSRLRVGRYDTAEVDAFRDAIRDTFLGVSGPVLTWRAPPGKQFTTTRRLRPGYDPEQVDAFVDKAERKLAAMESTGPEEPLVSGTILADGPSGPTQQDFQPPRWAEWAEWAEWADSARFATRKRSGYEPAEVDAFRQEIRDTFLGVRRPPLTLDEARDVRFRMARKSGYEVLEVDAFCDEAEQRLAAITPDIGFTQAQPQPWPQQGMQPPDRGVDPDGSATDAAPTPTDGDIPGWTPPPWSPDAADARPFWRRIPAGWLIAGALVLVLVGAFAGAYFNSSRSATDEPVGPAEPTQVLSGLPHDHKLRVDLRVGDCFDLNDPTADQIEDVKAVPCTTEHEFEVFYVGAMGKGSYPTDAAGEHRNHGRQVIDIEGAFWTYLDRHCIPAFRAYIGKSWYGGSDLDIYWLVPTDDAWRSGDRTMQCAAFNPVKYRLTESLRGTQQ
jgi:DivIVA domain-containing protein